MPAELSNVGTANDYTSATSLARPRGRRLTFQVANASIRYQLAQGWPGIRWGEELFLAPGKYSLDRRCTGVRVRSAVAGQPAQVTVTLVTAPELPGRDDG